MKGNSIIAVLIAGVFLIAGAGVALAEGWNDTFFPGSNQGQSQSSDQEQYEMNQPVETGNLPMEQGVSSAKLSPTEKIEVYENSDGLTYRRGIDEGP